MSTHPPEVISLRNGTAGGVPSRGTHGVTRIEVSTGLMLDKKELDAALAKRLTWEPQGEQ